MTENSGTETKIGWDIITTNPYILQTGDVIHVQGKGVLSFLIRLFSRGFFEPRSWASHSAMVLRITDGVEIIEATSKVGKRPIDVYKGKTSKLTIARISRGLNDDEKKEIIAKSEYYEGKKYGVIKIFLHFLDYILFGWNIFRRLACIDKYPICSWIVAYVYDRVLNYHFGIPPNAAQPDDISDFCVEDNWDFVWADSDESLADFNKAYKIRAARK